MDTPAWTPWGLILPGSGSPWVPRVSWTPASQPAALLHLPRFPCPWGSSADCYGTVLGFPAFVLGAVGCSWPAPLGRDGRGWHCPPELGCRVQQAVAGPVAHGLVAGVNRNCSPGIWKCQELTPSSTALTLQGCRASGGWVKPGHPDTLCLGCGGATSNLPLGGGRFNSPEMSPVPPHWPFKREAVIA